MSRWTVIGDGRWGRALARRLVHRGHRPTLVGERRIGAAVPKGCAHTIELDAALADTERVMVAVPVAAVEGLLTRAAALLRPDHRAVTAVRGLTPGSHLRPSEALRLQTPVRQVAVLAGAADADALRQKKPAALVVGSAFPRWAEEVQEALVGPALRIYTNPDPIGVELSGLIAIVVGVALGAGRAMKVGAATEATALTRALAEMDRVVQALGGQANTAYGLAGLGVLTEYAFAGDGDAFAAGTALAAGDLKQARSFEDVREAARALAARTARQRVRAPMIAAVDALFDGHIEAREALQGLMSRAARAEG